MITQAITVYASPAVAITASSNSICAGGSATLYAIGASAYLWSSGGNNYYTVVSPASTSTYAVNGSNSKCTTSIIYTVNVMQLPVITVSSNGPGTICSGEEVTLTGNGANSYEWLSTMTAVKQGTAIPIQPGGTITYSVFGTDANGCKGTTTYEQKVTECTGLSSESLTHMRVYPNPASHDITITNAGKRAFEMHDVTGRLVKSGETAGDKTVIAVYDLAAGVYYLSIKTAMDTVVMKFVKE
jgi:hypothetical protein